MSRDSSPLPLRGGDGDGATRSAQRAKETSGWTATPHPNPSESFLPSPGASASGGREGLSCANPLRGECEIAGFRLRPSFSALIVAEAELGSLFALVERAADGGLSLAETVALLWHCSVERPSREEFGEVVTAAGLVALAPALRVVLGQVLRGR